jgi:hypothetical protein
MVSNTNPYLIDNQLDSTPNYKEVGKTVTFYALSKA